MAQRILPETFCLEPCRANLPQALKGAVLWTAPYSCPILKCTQSVDNMYIKCKKSVAGKSNNGPLWWTRPLRNHHVNLWKTATLKSQISHCIPPPPFDPKRADVRNPCFFNKNTLRTVPEAQDDHTDPFEIFSQMPPRPSFCFPAQTPLVFQLQNGISLCPPLARPKPGGGPRPN